MKKLLPILIVLAGGVVLAQPQPELQTKYFPLKVGNRWTYVARHGKDDNPKADQKKTVVIAVEREFPFVRKIMTDAKDKDKVKAVTNTGFVLKMTSGPNSKEEYIAVLEDGVYRTRIQNAEITPPLCILKLGDIGKWTVNSKSGNATVKGTFTLKNTSVKVPAGDFDKAVLVSFTNGLVGDELVENDCWYVEKIGMVKQRVVQKEHEVVLELEKYELAK